ncbi:hypothetical protein BC834DRAFT_137919 [Gloeopeniophorella convolvens]|nr:hypothetical protein BC834DRAFT_137919 [Gloeopeniophorella convolvens]
MSIQPTCRSPCGYVCARRPPPLTLPQPVSNAYTVIIDIPEDTGIRVTTMPMMQVINISPGGSSHTYSYTNTPARSARPLPAPSPQVQRIQSPRESTHSPYYSPRDTSRSYATPTLSPRLPTSPPPQAGQYAQGLGLDLHHGVPSPRASHTPLPQSPPHSPSYYSTQYTGAPRLYHGPSTSFPRPPASPLPQASPRTQGLRPDPHPNYYSTPRSNYTASRSNEGQVGPGVIRAASPETRKRYLNATWGITPDLLPQLGLSE